MSKHRINQWNIHKHQSPTFVGATALFRHWYLLITLHLYCNSQSQTCKTVVAELEPHLQEASLKDKVQIITYRCRMDDWPT